MGRTHHQKLLAATLRRLGLDELNEQQDAHDIWLRLIDRLEQGLKASRRPRLVNELFEGAQRQVRRVSLKAYSRSVHTATLP